MRQITTETKPKITMNLGRGRPRSNHSATEDEDINERSKPDQKLTGVIPVEITSPAPGRLPGWTVFEGRAASRPKGPSSLRQIGPRRTRPRIRRIRHYETNRGHRQSAERMSTHLQGGLFVSLRVAPIPDEPPNVGPETPLGSGPLRGRPQESTRVQLDAIARGFIRARSVSQRVAQRRLAAGAPSWGRV